MTSRLFGGVYKLWVTLLLLALCLTVISCGRGGIGAAEATATIVSFATPVGLPGQPLTPYPGKPGETTYPTPFPAQSPVKVTPALPGNDPSFDNIEVPPYTPPPAPQPGDPYNLVINAGYIPGSVADLTTNADLVVIGTVTDIWPARWSTPDGKRPANPHSVDNRDTILTPIRVSVETPLKGSPEASDLFVSTIGGTVGKDSVRWGTDNDQLFKEGERVVLFLTRPGVTHRLAEIEKQTLWHLRNRFTVTPEGLTTNSYTSMPLAQLLREVAAAQAR